jgi:branched-chain amino acid aminotransferase
MEIYTVFFCFFVVKLRIMIAIADFNITKVKQSKLEGISLDNVPFGKYFSDHMLEVDYENGEWKTPSIKPYQPLLLAPSLAALHYGQAIFEGIKAYKDVDGKPCIFRPYDNFRRFNLSAERMDTSKSKSFFIHQAFYVW